MPFFVIRMQLDNLYKCFHGVGLGCRICFGLRWVSTCGCWTGSSTKVPGIGKRHETEDTLLRQTGMVQLYGMKDLKAIEAERRNLLYNVSKCFQHALQQPSRSSQANDVVLFALLVQRGRAGEVCTQRWHERSGLRAQVAFDQSTSDYSDYSNRGWCIGRFQR